MSSTPDRSGTPDTDAEPIPDYKEEMLTPKWNFNSNLLEFADKITENDLKRMKMLLEGGYGTGKRVLEEIKDGIDLMNYLKANTKLDNHNLIHLQALVWKSRNKELHKDFVKFAQSCRDEPFHFFEVDPARAGRQNVHFHIQGKATKNTVIENLRAMVAEYLCVDLEEVELNGVKPFKSIIITFSVPSHTAPYLLDLSTYQKRALQDMKIDQVQIGEKTVNLMGEKFDEMPQLTENDELKRIAKENEQLQQRFDNAQAQFLETEREIRNLRAQSKREQTSGEEKELLKRIRETVQDLTGPSTLKPDENIESTYQNLLEQTVRGHQSAETKIRDLAALNSKLIRQKETNLWMKHSEVLHDYLEFLLLQIDDHTHEEDRENRFDEMLHKLSDILSPGHQESLKVDTIFTITNEELLDKEPKRFLHVLLQEKHKEITATMDKYEKVKSMIQGLNDEELSTKSKTIFENAELAMKSWKSTTSKGKGDLMERPIYVRSASLGPTSSVETAASIYRQLETIQMTLKVAMNMPVVKPTW